MIVARAGPNGEIETRNRLKIVIEHVRCRIDDAVLPAILAKEVRCQDFDGRAGRNLPDRLDHLNEVDRAAILKVIAVH